MNTRIETKERVHVLNVRIPFEINIWLNSLVKRGIYKSRSEAIREFIRDYVKSGRGGMF